MIRHAIVFVIISLVVKSLGLLREIMIAHSYGTSVITDAYVIANNIPTVLFQSIGTAIAATFIPVFAIAIKEGGTIAAEYFTRDIIIVLIMISLPFLLLMEIFAPSFVYLFAPGFSQETLTYAIPFAMILMPTIIFMGIMNVLGAYLQYYQKFTILGLVPVVGNFVIIIGLLLANALGNIYIFIYSTLIGICSQVGFYLITIKKFKLWKSNIIQDIAVFRNKYINMMIPLIIPVFIGSAINDFNTVVGRALVSGIGPGSVSSLDYANKIEILVIGVVMGGTMTVVYPQLAKLALLKDLTKFKAFSKEIISITFLIMLPIIYNILLFNREFIAVIFQRGKFDVVSTNNTAEILVFFTVGFLGLGLREVIVKIYYSLHDTKTPMKNGILCAIVNIILSIWFINIMGVKGVALSSSIAAWLTSMILLVKAYQRQWIDIPVMDILKMCVVALVVMLLEKWLLEYKIIHSNLLGGFVDILLIATLGIIVYLILLFFIKSTIVCKMVMILIKKIM